MKQHIIELLAYPRYLILGEINANDCPHHGYHDENDARCEFCVLGEECRWLADNEAFIALARKPVDNLIEALEFGIDYTASRLDRHNAKACICDSCAWLRNARRFLRQYSIDKRRGITGTSTDVLSP